MLDDVSSPKSQSSKSGLSKGKQRAMTKNNGLPKVTEKNESDDDDVMTVDGV